MKKNLYIVTGGSKGLGRAIVEKIIAQNDLVIAVSRTEIAKNTNKNLVQLKHNLLRTFSKTEKVLNTKISKINFKKIHNIYLINNAAQIQPVSAVGELSSVEVQKHIFLNFTVPVLLTNWFMSQKTDHRGNKVIVQISSGAASFAITNWSIYCSSKAAIEMFNCVMQIQLEKNKKVKAFTYSPGIIDTNMQAQIRRLKKSDFPEVERFKKYKKTSELRSPESVATHLLSLLYRPEKIKSKSYSID